MKDFRFIDLFAGIGGFRLALESAGGTCLGFSEIAQDAIKAYCANFGEDEANNFGDITKIKTLPEHDFMTAGVPCQSWSIAGKNLGFDDDRGQLWNDTLYLLNKVRPKAFIFENVKGLADPRNRNALDYILKRINEAGYYAKHFVINAYDYGVPQTRIRIYIVGFRERKFLEKLRLAIPCPGKTLLSDVLDNCDYHAERHPVKGGACWSLSCNEQGFNDYFLFNDLRNGLTTIHSWDIKKTTDRQKQICHLLLRNRRKSEYGILDGNPLSLRHFQELDQSITRQELDELVDIDIFKKVSYMYEVISPLHGLPKDLTWIISQAKENLLNYDLLKTSRDLKRRKIKVADILSFLEKEKIIRCVETRYDFKNTKISTGLYGINRIFLPSCKIYPTLVASDTNDFITTRQIHAETAEEFKKKFMKYVYEKGDYRQISKEESCRIQGFPADYILPPTRARWMKLIGNSVAVPVVKMLVEAVTETGVFDNAGKKLLPFPKQLNIFDTSVENAAYASSKHQPIS